MARAPPRRKAGVWCGVKDDGWLVTEMRGCQWNGDVHWLNVESERDEKSGMLRGGITLAPTALDVQKIEQ